MPFGVGSQLKLDLSSEAIRLHRNEEVLRCDCVCFVCVCVCVRVCACVKNIVINYVL